MKEGWKVCGVTVVGQVTVTCFFFGGGGGGGGVQGVWGVDHVFFLFIFCSCN